MMGPLSLIWDKLPAPLRWIILAGVILFYTPLKIREEAIQFVDTRVYAVITPMKDQRDMQILTMEQNIKDIKDDMREVRNHLLKGNK